jgi:hypothetical protein
MIAQKFAGIEYVTALVSHLKTVVPIGKDHLLNKGSSELARYKKGEHTVVGKGYNLSAWS